MTKIPKYDCCAYYPTFTLAHLMLMILCLTLEIVWIGNASIVTAYFMSIRCK